MWESLHNTSERVHYYISLKSLGASLIGYVSTNLIYAYKWIKSEQGNVSIPCVQGNKTG